MSRPDDRWKPLVPPVPIRVIPSTVVDELVARLQRELDALRAELDRSVVEAEEAERRAGQATTPGHVAPGARPAAVLAAEPLTAQAPGGAAGVAAEGAVDPPAAWPPPVGPPSSAPAAPAEGTMPPAGPVTAVAEVPSDDPHPTLVLAGFAVPASRPAAGPVVTDAGHTAAKQSLFVNGNGAPEPAGSWSTDTVRTAPMAAPAATTGTAGTRARTTVVTRPVAPAIDTGPAGDMGPSAPAVVADRPQLADGPSPVADAPERDPAAVAFQSFWEDVARQKSGPRQGGWLSRVPFTLMMQVGIAVVVVAVVLFTLG